MLGHTQSKERLSLNVKESGGLRCIFRAYPMLGYAREVVKITFRGKLFQ